MALRVDLSTVETNVVKRFQAETVKADTFMGTNSKGSTLKRSNSLPANPAPLNRADITLANPGVEDPKLQVRAAVLTRDAMTILIEGLLAEGVKQIDVMALNKHFQKICDGALVAAREEIAAAYT